MDALNGVWSDTYPEDNDLRKIRKADKYFFRKS